MKLAKPQLFSTTNDGGKTWVYYVSDGVNVTDDYPDKAQALAAWKRGDTHPMKGL